MNADLKCIRIASLTEKYEQVNRIKSKITHFVPAYFVYDWSLIFVLEKNSVNEQ